jgi:hypothetical protein
MPRIDAILRRWGALLPCEASCLLLGLLKRLGIGNDAFWTGVCFGADVRRHVVVGTHVGGQVKFVVCINLLEVVFGSASRCGVGDVAIVVSVFRVSRLAVLVAHELVEFVLGRRRSHVEDRWCRGGHGTICTRG